MDACSDIPGTVNMHNIIKRYIGVPAGLNLGKMTVKAYLVYLTFKDVKQKIDELKTGIRS